MNIFVVAAYNIIILGGTAYLVGWQDWNPWWFAFTLLVGASLTEKECKK
jgi:hypothetical protein